MAASRRRKVCTERDGSVQDGIPQAIGYVRVSTEEQAKYGVSLDAQLTRIQAYCTLAGLHLARVISEDGVSGAKKLDSRPGGSQLTEALRKRTVLHVVALKLDRLFRDAEDALSQTRTWDRAGVALHIIDMGGSALNTASAMGRMFLTMTAAFAELERNLIGERTSTALAHKKAQRKVYSPTPFGFTRSGDALEVDTGEMDTLEIIRRWQRDGLTYRAIACQLNAREVPTKRGGRQWYASTVQQILANDLHV